MNCYLSLAKTLFSSFNWAFNFAALLCAVPTAFLAFKERFKSNYKSQCTELIRQENADYKKDIRNDYRIFAFLFYGVTDVKNHWMHIFMGPDSDVVKRMESDKSDAVRGLLWFSGFFIFALLAIISSLLK